MLRRPPLGHVLPTAHDMAREYRVLSALRGTDIPVPAPLAICADPEVIGAPFYLMEYVDGLVLRTRQDGEQLTPDQAGQLSERLAGDARGDPRVDIEAAGPDAGSAGRTGTWPASWPAGSGSGSCRRPGRCPATTGWSSGWPPDCRKSATTRWCTGTSGWTTCWSPWAQQPAIAAVVDWEMSTLGDPLADLGLTLIYWADPDDARVAGRSTSGPR